jgi:hypothetical protein
VTARGADGTDSWVRPAAAPLALAALLLLAGCGASLGGGDAERTDRLTPVDVPGDREADAPVVVPGLSEAGVYAPATFRRSYREAVAGRSFRLYRSATVYPRGAVPSTVAPAAVATATPTPPATKAAAAGTTTGATASGPAAGPTPSGTATGTPPPPALGVNDSYDRIVVRAVVDDPDERYLFSRIETSATAYRTASPFARIDVWYSAPTVRNRLVDAGGVVRHWGRNEVQPGGPISDPTRAEFVVGDLAAFDLRTADRRVVDGSTRYRFVGSLRRDRIDPPTLVTDPRDGRIEAVVTERGVVRRYRLSYDATLEGRPVTVVKTHAVVGIGRTTVPQPGWLDAANRSVAGPSAALGAGTGVGDR